MIQGVIVHLANDLPILVDMEELPSGGDRVIRCTNVRMVDGKRPAFAHHQSSTFIFPLQIVRLIEVPQMSEGSAIATQDEHSYEARGHDPEPELVLDEVDEEAEEDLLARIRSI
jgi:hypothetical protein